jgi:signal transduction histidine kinase
MRATRIAGDAGVAIIAVALGIALVRVARSHPDQSLAGEAWWASVAALAAGWGLVTAGLTQWVRRPTSRSGPLLAAAGLAWFLPEAAIDQNVGSALAFTAGLVLSAACAPLLAHAALTYPHDRPRTRYVLVVVATGYLAAVGVLGVLSTVLYDPRAQLCQDCPANLVHLGGSAGAQLTSARLGLWLVCGWALVAAALLGWRIIRVSGPRRARDAAVLAPAAVYLALVAVDAAHGIGRGYQSNDLTDRRLWAGEAAALIFVALGTGWDGLRRLRTRRELKRLVAELGADRSSRGVRDALVRALGEPNLILMYPTATGWIASDGKPVGLLPRTFAATQLMADGKPLGAIGHRPQALDDSELVAEIARAARPALERERLEAEIRAQLHELRASRARIVAAADAERRRLERDLHDGAQQRLVALALDLRLARRHVIREASELDRELAAAEEDLRLAVADLRTVAHGIHPAILEQSGLDAALLALAEETPRLILGELPQSRLPATVESAAYELVAETLRRAPEGTVKVRGQLTGGRLALEVASQTRPLDSVIDLEDRIGALDGQLSVQRFGNHTTLVAELPCES